MEWWREMAEAGIDSSTLTVTFHCACETKMKNGNRNCKRKRRWKEKEKAEADKDLDALTLMFHYTKQRRWNIIEIKSKEGSRSKAKGEGTSAKLGSITGKRSVTYLCGSSIHLGVCFWRCERLQKEGLMNLRDAPMIWSQGFKAVVSHRFGDGAQPPT